MLNCKEISILVSESIDRNLTLWQRLSVRIHVAACRFCRQFRKDIIHIHKRTGEQIDDIDTDFNDTGVKLSAESLERMKRQIESQL